MWQRIKMFNVKLMTTNVIRRLRIWVLVFSCPFEGKTLFSALFSALAHGASATTLLTRGTISRVAAARFNLTPVILAAGTLSLLLFQGVRPVILSISPRIVLASCALNVGCPNGFPMGLVLAEGVPPLPLLPLPPLPHSGHLGSMVAGMLHPLEGTL